MKFSTSFVALTHFALAFAVAVPEGQDCGVLGVMPVPEGADASEYRKCLEHPIQLLDGTLEERDSDLVARACYHGNQTPACSKDGWCYMNCDVNGEWCWMAENRGKGAWTSCKSHNDCVTAYFKRAAFCGVGGCKDCGCSC